MARPAEAEALIGALPDGDRALWATALNTGLRRGELQALRWSRVDLDAGIISVTNGWDRVAGLIEPKSRAARRRVPLPGALRPHLLAARLRGHGGDEGFVFATAGGTPFDPPPWPAGRGVPGPPRASSRSASTSADTATPRT